MAIGKLPFPVHPLADLLPQMSAEDAAQLRHDIDVHGQREPATVWRDANGTVWLIDGRHRAVAANALGRDLSYVMFTGSEEDARALVMSKNIHRRHLSVSARALAAGALARRRPGGIRGMRSGTHTELVPPTQREAAARVGVSERLVRDGSLIISSGLDDVVNAVASGAMTVTAAAALVRETQADRRAAAALYLAHRRSSASDTWLTPQWLVERAAACLGGIDEDVAAKPERGIPATWWLTAKDDALNEPSRANPDGTAARIWMNPPYNSRGQGPGAWTRRAVTEWNAGRVQSALLLLPARPGSQWQSELHRFPRVELHGHLTFEPGIGNPARDEWLDGRRGEAPFASSLFGIGIPASVLHLHFGDVGNVSVPYDPA